MVSREIFVQKNDYSPEAYKKLFLVGDVGATHTTLALVGERTYGELRIIFKEERSTAAIHELSAEINDVLTYAFKEYGIEAHDAVISAAGNIDRRKGYVKLTNAGLHIDKRELLAKTALTGISLLNDFEAVAYGIDVIDMEKDVESLIPNNKLEFRKKEVLAIIGPGTGLGMSILPYDQTRNIHIPVPSEGGHIGFMPLTYMEWDLYNYLKNEILKDGSEPDIEFAVSGNGMHYIYNFLRARNVFPETNITKKIDVMNGNEKLNEIEINYSTDDTCRRTLNMFASFYARAAQSLALMSSCSGLFLWGKITHKILPVLRSGQFINEFNRHTKKSLMLSVIPVFVITNLNTSILGCANYGKIFH